MWGRDAEGVIVGVASEVRSHDVRGGRIGRGEHLTWIVVLICKRCCFVIVVGICRRRVEKRGSIKMSWVVLRREI